jgi:hypothetical protein
MPKLKKVHLGAPLPQNIKVGFIIAGTQKGGTTTLDQYLREHQAIQMATKKEVHYFDNESIFDKAVDYSEYHSNFIKALPEKIIYGEATPIYMYWYDVPRRIWDYNPHMKFIIVLRNPIERAYSHWNMERDRGRENLSFSDAIRTEKLRCRNTLPLQHRVFSYIDRGFYSEQLRRIWHFFPKEQTLILKSQNLKNDPNETLSAIYKFLNIPNFQKIKHKELHTRNYVSKITEVDHEYLKDIFYYEIKELEKILDWCCSDWLQ